MKVHQLLGYTPGAASLYIGMWLRLFLRRTYARRYRVEQEIPSLILPVCCRSGESFWGGNGKLGVVVS